MSRFSRWAQTEYPFRARIAATLLAGVIFLILLPYLILVICPSLDQRLGIGGFSPGIPTYILGGIMSLGGLFFGLWSIVEQLTRGRGTPLPMMPTQGLLTTGPFRYCRNPMTFGAVLIYLGMSIAAGTVVGVAVTLSLASPLMVYLKRVEEKELAERFGEEYLAYKREVPFIIPMLQRRD